MILQRRNSGQFCNGRSNERLFRWWLHPLSCTSGISIILLHHFRNIYWHIGNPVINMVGKAFQAHIWNMAWAMMTGRTQYATWEIVAQRTVQELRHLDLLLGRRRSKRWVVGAVYRGRPCLAEFGRGTWMKNWVRMTYGCRSESEWQSTSIEKATGLSAYGKSRRVLTFSCATVQTVCINMKSPNEAGP